MTQNKPTTSNVVRERGHAHDLKNRTFKLFGMGAVLQGLKEPGFFFGLIKTGEHTVAAGQGGGIMVEWGNMVVKESLWVNVLLSGLGRDRRYLQRLKFPPNRRGIVSIC